MLLTVGAGKTFPVSVQLLFLKLVLCFPVNTSWIFWDSLIYRSFRLPFASSSVILSMLDGGLPLTNMHFGSFDWDTLTPSFVENAVHGFLAL